MTMNVPLLMLVCCSVAVFALKTECPPPEETTCVCKSVYFGFEFHCSQITTVEDLKSNLTVLRGYKISQLTLYGINVTHVPVDLFVGLHIGTLYLKRFEMKAENELQRNYFFGLEKTLGVLTIEESFTSSTHFKLDDLTQLRKLRLDDNNIIEMGNDWFSSGPKRLELLGLLGNGIEKLGDKVFQSLVGLRQLDVEGNFFSEVSRSMFPSPAPDLWKINLSFNKIKNLPEDLFEDMPALHKVYLNNNVIHTIIEGTLNDNQDYSTYLYGNPLRCDSELEWICFARAEGVCSSPPDKRGLKLKQSCKPRTYFL